MKILYNNLTLSAGVTANSENPQYTFATALIDPRLSRIGRTYNGTKTNVNINIWLESDHIHKIVNCAMLNKHNFTSSAIVSINATNSPIASYSSEFEKTWDLPIEDAMYKEFTYDKYIANDPVTTNYTLTVGGDAMLVNGDRTTINVSTTTFYFVTIPLDYGYAYWVIKMTDPLNTNTYLELASVYLGEPHTMPGFAPGGALYTTSNSSFETSESMQLYGRQGKQYKIGEFEFPVLSYTEMLIMDAFYKSADVVNPFYMFVWENDLDIEPVIYMSLDEYPEIRKIEGSGITYKANIKVREAF
jgi:hypothetical protein